MRLAAALLLLPALASAQPAPTLAQPAPTCAALITDAEVTRAVGAVMENMGPDTRGTGVTECSWMLRGQGPLKTLFVGVHDLTAVKATMQGTPAKLFETYASTAEELGKTTRTPVAGVGQQAAIVKVEQQTQLLIQRADGFVRVVANGLSNAQLTAIARAIMTP
jgi:hypothetical protein